MTTQIKDINEKWELVDCNLCGSNNYKYICSYGDIRIVKCNNCNLIYRNPRLKEDLNREFYSLDYYGEYEGIEEQISAARIYLFKSILSRLDKNIGSSYRKLLDIGCGQGHFLSLAKDLGWQVEGVELARSACDYAEREFGIDLINKSIEEADFKDNSFDVITLWNVLDHLLDPITVLKETYRILKPGGILVIRIPNANLHLLIHKFFSLLPNNLVKNKFHDPSVILNYGFNRKTIKKILEKAGFAKIKIYNSPLTYGDPYKSLKFLGDNLVNISKISLEIISWIIFLLSFGKFCISSSLIVYAKK